MNPARMQFGLMTSEKDMAHARAFSLCKALHLCGYWNTPDENVILHECSTTCGKREANEEQTKPTEEKPLLICKKILATMDELSLCKDSYNLWMLELSMLDYSRKTFRLVNIPLDTNKMKEARERGFVIYRTISHILAKLEPHKLLIHGSNAKTTLRNQNWHEAA